MRRLLFAFVALLAAALAAGLPGAARSWHGDREGRIAFQLTTFAAGAPPTVDIVTVDPDGSDVRQVTDTSPGGFSENPAWTPDGEHILFDSDRADGFPHLFVMRANGRNLRQLTSGQSFQGGPTMSPDGRLIAFNGQTFDPADSGIHVVGRRGGTVDDFRRLTVFPGPDPNGADVDPDFSPDGTKIVFARDGVTRETAPAGQAAIFVVDVDGTGLRQLTPYALDAETPRWSPDGKRIAFDVNAEEHSAERPNDLYVMNADGSALTQLTHEGGGSNSFHPDWSPDGRKLVFAHRNVGASSIDIDVIDLRSGRIATVWHGLDNTFAARPSWGTRS
jgi:TolB protein